MSRSRMGAKVADAKGPVVAEEAGLPLYARLRADIVRRIRSGEWPPGTKIPTHQELCRQYSVSRITVVKALKDLEADSIVTGLQGVGTFVSDLGASEGLTDLGQLFRKTFASPDPPIHRLLSIDGVTSGDAGLTSFFSPEEDLTRVTRIRIAEGRPAIYEQAFMLRAVIPPSADPTTLADTLLHDFLTETCGVTLRRTRVYIGVSRLSEEQARLLERDAAEPSLQITRISYGVGARPVAVSVNTHPGAQYAYYFDYEHAR